MTAISFKLEVFEGPLDLLLNLISKHKLNIQDIEISKLLEQYLVYINQCGDSDFELAGEFLEMAAHLVYIKTVSLLPQAEEAEQLKKELEGRLIEYSLCKFAAALLRDMFIGGDIFVRKPMKIKSGSAGYRLTHDAQLLADAYLGMGHTKRITPEAQKISLEEKIRSVAKGRVVSVISKVVRILRELYKCGEAYIGDLYNGVTDRSERVAIFLALLELCRSGRIVLNEDNTVIAFRRKGGDLLE